MGANNLGPHWAPLQPETMDYLHIDFSGSHLQTFMRTHLQSTKVALWNILLPEVVDNCYSCQQEGDNLSISSSKTWIFFGLTIGLLLVVILLLCIIIWGTQKNKKYTQLLRNNSEKSYAVNL